MSDIPHDRFECQASGVMSCTKCDFDFIQAIIGSTSRPSLHSKDLKVSELVNSLVTDCKGVIRCSIGYSQLNWGGEDKRLYLIVQLNEGVRSKFVAEELFERAAEELPYARLSWANVDFVWAEPEGNEPSEAVLNRNDDAAAVTTAPHSAEPTLNSTTIDTDNSQTSPLSDTERLIARVAQLEKECASLQNDLHLCMQSCQRWAFWYMGTGRGELGTDSCNDCERTKTEAINASSLSQTQVSNVIIVAVAAALTAIGMRFL